MKLIIITVISLCYTLSLFSVENNENKKINNILTRAKSAKKKDPLIDQKLDFLQKHFANESPKDRLWWWSWMGFSATVLGATTLQYALAKDENTRKAQYIGYTLGGLSLASNLLGMRISTFAHSRLRTLSQATYEEKASKLKIAENYLTRSARNQAFGVSWLNRVMTYVTLAIASTVEWLKFDRLPFAAVKFFGGIAISEFKFFTQPKGSIGALHSYAAKFSRGNTAYTSSKDPVFMPLQFTIGPGMIAVSAFF